MHIMCHIPFTLWENLITQEVPPALPRIHEEAMTIVVIFDSFFFDCATSLWLCHLWVLFVAVKSLVRDILVRRLAVPGLCCAATCSSYDDSKNPS